MFLLLAVLLMFIRLWRQGMEACHLHWQW